MTCSKWARMRRSLRSWMIRPEWIVLWTDDGGDGAVSAVAQDDMPIEQRRHGVAGHDDVVAVT